jgi:hypothetical protein
VHCPATHVTPVAFGSVLALHVLPHPPQFCRLVFVSMQTLLQSVPELPHAVPQAVPSHVAEPPLGVGHGVHDAPHVATDVFEAQAPLQSWVPAGHAHLLAEHVFPPVHAPAQLPQWAASVVVSTQAPPQSVYPASHANEQAPAEHELSACEGAGQAFPHAPQLLTSCLMSTQVVLQSVGASLGHEETQEYAPAVLTHLSFVPLQASLHDPQ